jgi:hypothetical protein
MKVELHRNGELQIFLIPEDKIESGWLEEMADRADRGRVVRLRRDGDGAESWFAVAIEK